MFRNRRSPWQRDTGATSPPSTLNIRTRTPRATHLPTTLPRQVAWPLLPSFNLSVLGFFFHWASHSNRIYLVLLGFTGFHWVSLGFTGFYWVLLGFTGFYWVLPSCWMVRDFLFGFFVRPGTDFEFTKKAQLRAAERRPVRPHRRRGRRWLRPLRQPVLAAPMQVQFQNPVKPSKTHYNWVKPSKTQ